MRRKNRQVSAVLRALSNATIRRENGMLVITISIGALTVVIKLPP
ncbi:MAG: hypothetical protein AABO41_11235 [Acidobacteriota bacterium]